MRGERRENIPFAQNTEINKHHIPLSVSISWALASNIHGTQMSLCDWKSNFQSFTQADKPSLVQSATYGCRNVTNPLMCTMLAVPRVDVNTLGLNHPAFGSLEAVFPRVHFRIFSSPGWELSQCLLGSYSTERSWQDLDLSQNATLGLFFATTLSRKRLAFVGMLSQCVLHFKCLRRLLASLESLRRRSCRTMPWKASQTLCCMAADVSINLQSNTAAQARPSETESQTISTSIKSNNSEWLVFITCKKTGIVSAHHWLTPLCVAQGHICSPPGWLVCAGQDGSDEGLSGALRLAGMRPGQLQSTATGRHHLSACSAPAPIRCQSA